MTTKERLERYAARKTLQAIGQTKLTRYALNTQQWAEISMSIILFGARSPLVVEYEETCLRLGIEIAGSISLNGAPRVLDATKIIEYEEFTRRDMTDPFVACAFAPKRRGELAEMARSAGLVPCEALVDPTAIVARSVRIGAGSYVNSGGIIGAASLVGENVLVNRAASLGHHTIVGDFVSVGPGATLASNIFVGDGAIIGAGAVVLPNVRIGAGAIISAGSVVRKDVGDEEFVVGNPAVPRKFNYKRSALNVDDDE